MRSSGHVVLRPRYRRACAVVRGAAFGRRLVRGGALALRKGATLDDADRAAFRGSLELRGGLATRPLGVSRDPPPIPRHVAGARETRDAPATRAPDTATDAGVR